MSWVCGEETKQTYTLTVGKGTPDELVYKSEVGVKDGKLASIKIPDAGIALCAAEVQRFVWLLKALKRDGIQVEEETEK